MSETLPSSTSPAQVPASRAFEISSLIFFALIALSLSGLVFLDTGWRGIGLFGLGGILGVAFLRFQYGFASVWRQALVRGEVMGLSAHFLLIGLCAMVFIPTSFWGLNAVGTIAPISVSLFIGAFMFGIGMQLANGCGSGVLFSFGAGSGRMVITLPFFILGSLLGSFLLPTVLEWGSAGPIAVAGSLSELPKTALNLAIIGGVGMGFYLLGRRRGQHLPATIFIASIIIAILCWAVFALSGHPWGVTFGFTLWGAKIMQDLGVPVENFTFWQWSGPARSLKHSLLSDTSSLMNIGMVLGAGMLASISGHLSGQDWPPARQLMAAALGGILMGIGARLSFGCNIGTFLGGIASGSLHGWIWFALAMAGSFIGIQLRPKFGLSK